MYFRRKQTEDREYLVANTRIDGKPQQKVLATLGRVDELQASGQMDRLLESGARFSETALVLSALKAGEIDTIAQHRIGAPLVFERLWQESGCRDVIETLLQDRGDRGRMGWQALRPTRHTLGKILADADVQRLVQRRSSSTLQLTRRNVETIGKRLQPSNRGSSATPRRRRGALNYPGLV